MISEIPQFGSARVLVLGDVMLDRYWMGETSRISPEAPVPVVKVGDIEERAGGAGNVAINIAALGANATVVGLTGEDDAANSLLNLMQQAGVTPHFSKDLKHATVTKLRILSRNQQLIRLDFEDGFPHHNNEQLLEIFSQQVQQAGAVILSDYGKGTLQDCQSFIQQAAQHQIPVLVDPKGSDFSKYKGATLITPNLSEFEQVVGHCKTEKDIVDKGSVLLEELNLSALLITRSEKGMTLLQRGKDALHLPTRAREVYDVTGAGDTVISVLAASLAAGVDLAEATMLSNLAAGVVVNKIGTATVSQEELKQAMRQTHSVQRGVMDEDEMLQLARQAQSCGEKIVMTNGCFDILHTGHVAYLEEAALLGERLIVAVNDDASIKRLKGEDRPVNPMEKRMRMLAALECVDWVVPFYEDTPTRLICKLSPDILVKGGDNKVDDIPGGDCVREAGGEVRVLIYVDGVSTTEIISSIRETENKD
ncbi:ADP-heptose synthase / D-glycero-beta-D-manno-heptose 7-phosphate kinase [hydrothermal vent metagenome]|uniref:D-glycero-beta-D-manno-heptose 1-phosphate adenylyltransferase n=1 Tax=hydrothermal vent metagenome TaxID=652676 RepID=A0A3B1AYQ4_9ZZZZ